ncbi:MAG: hypothetical protein HY966_03120, partial [Ignavibacteriales bacterium]|nr:hypothetical protein [Ignavibacteriales bacterium]
MAIELLDQILPHVKDAVHPKRISISDWKMKEGDLPGAHLPKFKDSSWVSIRVPFEWGKFGRTFWFRTKIVVPPELAGQHLALLLDFPEALLYVNGHAYHGLDANHQEVLLAEKAKANQEFVLAIQAYAGRKKEHNTFGDAELVVLNPVARGLYHGLAALKSLEAEHEHGSQPSKDLRELVRRTLVFLKYFKPGGEEYPNAIARAYDFLSTAAESELLSGSPPLMH